MDSSNLDESCEMSDISSNSNQNPNEFEDSSELKDENTDSCQKTTFKNVLQAKNRLKAFAQQKQILISPKSKPITCGETTSSTGSKVKKENPMDRAKATVEEIELLKVSEFTQPVNNELMIAQRSRSKSPETDFVFRKRERKIRNYRRTDNSHRSPSPAITTAKEKSKKPEKSKNNQPKNWEEFKKDKWTFEKMRDSHFKKRSQNSSNDVCRHLLFEAPADLIKMYRYKSEKGEEIVVPQKFLRYTSARPKISYNVNIYKSKEPYLKRQQVLDKTPKSFKTILEKFYSKCGKKCKTSEPMGQRNWYQRNWKDSDSKVLEASIGLSFLQTYSDDEEDDDQQLVDSSELMEPAQNSQKDKKESDEMNLLYSQEIMEPLRTYQLPKETMEELENSMKRKRSISIDKNANGFDTESKKTEENVSWTPERRPSLSEDPQLENPEITRTKFISEPEKNKIKTDKNKDEDILYENKSEEKLLKKNKKRKKSKQSDSDTSSSEEEEKSKSKKKNKLGMKKKHKEKDKKTKKKEKQKAEKIRKAKKKQKEKDKKKEILKKLKKELEQKLEDERASELQKLEEMSIKVKVEKKDDDENLIQSPKEIENSFEKKERDYEDNDKKINKARDKQEIQEEFIDVKVKKEKITEDCKEKEVKETVKVDKNILDKPKTKQSKQKKKEEIIPGEETPNTDEYQSNWESDEGVSPFKPPSKRKTRGWESDEEVFERAFLKKEPGDVPFAKSPLLEMPLDIKFPKRRFSKPEKQRSRTRSPEFLDMDKEIKLLEEERINLNNERMQLEMEKIRIHELERKKSMEEMEYMTMKDSSPVWHKKQLNQEKWNRKEANVVSTSKEIGEKEMTEASNNDKEKKPETITINTDEADTSVVVSVHSSPEITSTKSPAHTGLESAYQEFMRAVSGSNIIISSGSEDYNQKEKTKQVKVRYSKSQRDKNRAKNLEANEQKKLVSTTDPKILQEILLPDEIPMPEVPPPIPVPVPSPKLDLSQNILTSVVHTATPSDRVQDKIAIVTSQKIEDNIKNDDMLEPSESSTSVKPFTFSTLVIPSKKSLLLERSKWKLDDDSEEEISHKFGEIENTMLERNVEPSEDHPIESEIQMQEDTNKSESSKIEEKVDEVRYIKVEKEKKIEREERKDDISSRRRYTRSRSPQEARDKRRKEDIKRKEDDKRRDSGHRREENRRRTLEDEQKRRDRDRRPTSPKRRESPSRRRRSPIHRRSSPRHKSPRRKESRRSDRRSPARSSPQKRRRSYSPRPSTLPRRRSPSPRRSSQMVRRSKSPRRSPVDGLKRSVADSTISDDLLPQHYSVDSSSSPLCSTPAPPSRRQRLTLSPKRPSLDERINQVLGVESQPQPVQTWKPTEPSSDPRQNLSYSGYPHHDHSAEMGLSSSLPHTSKVLQVGNILQVVPSEDLCLPPQPVAPPSQMILQVGNMLQIVPSEMEAIVPPLPPLPPLEVPESSPLPEKSSTINPVPERHSAEDVLVERMAERNKKRLEKEERRKEKERKKKDKDKKKKMKLKVTTEEMIKRALELDGYMGTEDEDLSAMVPEVIYDSPGLDSSRSILSTSIMRIVHNSMKTEKERKSVQFADGVLPGEGTSPSGGEELSSPPPQTDILLKPKKLKKLGSVKKRKKKKKSKVKVNKRPVPPPPTTASDEEYENLPPPSPPPGSPPPSVFPPRAKVHTINNIPQHYLPAYGISTAPQTPPVVQPPRINMPYQTPPTAMYNTPPPQISVASQHFQPMGHASHMNMNIPPPPPPMHRDQQPYRTF